MILINNKAIFYITVDHHVSYMLNNIRTYVLFNMRYMLKTTQRHNAGSESGGIKCYGIVAPQAEIAFASLPEFGTFWNVHYPAAASFKRKHVSRTINMLREKMFLTTFNISDTLMIR